MSSYGIQNVGHSFIQQTLPMQLFCASSVAALRRLIVPEEHTVAFNSQSAKGQNIWTPQTWAYYFLPKIWHKHAHSRESLRWKKKPFKKWTIAVQLSRSMIDKWVTCYKNIRGGGETQPRKCNVEERRLRENDHYWGFCIWNGIIWVGINRNIPRSLK